MNYNGTLDTNVYNYRANIVKKHDSTVKYRNLEQEWVRYQQLNGIQNPTLRVPDFWDWPAIIVACSDNSNVVCDFSRGVKAIHLCNPLLHKLSSLGIIGQKRKYIVSGCEMYSKNRLGYCAEQHAANKLYKKGSNCQLNNLSFSRAIRPRTGEQIDYCDNCQLIFS